MKLLVLTQTVDRDDPVLGFFHGWIRAFSKRFEHIHVVCLREGVHDLPSNVSVYSLGKERGKGRLTYVLRFYWYVWSLRRHYDAALVHMNPEYVILGGLLWRLLGKRIFMWRNHWRGGIMTDVAVLLAHKTFCTSKASYITKYKKNMLMPVGIDMELFTPKEGITRKPRSILSLGRIAPSKNIHVILQALKMLREKGIEFSASIVGDALPKDEVYLMRQKQFIEKSGLSDRVTFLPGVPNRDTVAIYSANQIFVNASASGMFDKTIFEALACGATPVACSSDYGVFAGNQFTFEPGNANSLERKLEELIHSPTSDGVPASESLRAKLVREHSLAALTNDLVLAMEE